MNKANVSVFMIVKNDECCLEKCLLSFRDFVEEVVIVDTGSTDKTPEIAKKYADIFEVYTDCNDSEGRIESFAKARNRSLELTTKKWVLWVDSDDIISGAEKLKDIIEATEKQDISTDTTCFMFPYEYSYNESGQVLCRHYRERLFSNKHNWKAVNPCHEVFIPLDNKTSSFITTDEIVYKHQRQYLNKPIESGRNLRILEKYVKEIGDTDLRQLYYLGLEFFNVGRIDEAVDVLSRYTEKSGWNDEITMAALKLVDIFTIKANYKEGIKWAFKAVEVCETWAEGYFALAKMFYFLAIQGGPTETDYWKKCIYFGNIGLNLPLTKTLLFINPQERDVEIHRYLNIALHKLGNIKGALDSVNYALNSQPNDPSLLLNKKIYEVYLLKSQAIESLNKLKELGGIDNQIAELIKPIENKELVADKEIIISDLVIPKCKDIAEKPFKLTNDQLESIMIILWKEYMLNDDSLNAINLLSSPPRSIKDSKIITSALEMTKEFYSRQQNEPIRVREKLDIVFFIGDGVETWTPDTVKKTGIGGSELMAMEQAKRLAALGHKVRLYNSCGFFGAKEYDGVKYEQTKDFHDLECDVLIVSRRADYLGDQFNITAKLRLLWVHDVTPIVYTNKLLLKADRILCLSEWHKQNVIKNCNVHPNQIIVTRNGVDISRFKGKNIVRDKYKCVNFSSPDRSWPILLEIWVRIKERVPQATLTLGYGFKNWKFAAKYDQLQMDLIHRLEDQIKQLEPLGVRYIDRVNQERVAEEYLSAGVVLYPTWFTETNFIGGAECQLGGARFVGSSIAAINETVGDRGVLIPGEWTSEQYKNDFVEAAVKALKEA